MTQLFEGAVKAGMARNGFGRVMNQGMYNFAGYMKGDIAAEGLTAVGKGILFDELAFAAQGMYADGAEFQAYTDSALFKRWRFTTFDFEECPTGVEDKYVEEECASGDRCANPEPECAPGDRCDVNAEGVKPGETLPTAEEDGLDKVSGRPELPEGADAAVIGIHSAGADASAVDSFERTADETRPSEEYAEKLERPSTTIPLDRESAQVEEEREDAAGTVHRTLVDAAG